MTRRARNLLVASVLALLATDVARADFRARTELETTYLHEPEQLARTHEIHRIAIRGNLGNLWGGQGVLTLDPNECAVNEFGDTMWCTKINLIRIDVDFRRLKVVDPSAFGYGRRLFEIVGHDLPKRLLLVTPSTRGVGEAYRLIVQKEDGAVERVVAMTPIQR